MTLQFRTRTKSVYDYGKDLKAVGKCCFSDGSSQNYTFVECFQRGGNFFPDPTITCPQESAKGYCCSCIFTSEYSRDLFVRNVNIGEGINSSLFQVQDGIRDNITECECSRIGGNWSSVLPNPPNNMCQKNVTISGIGTVIDVRVPSACCYPFYNGLTFVAGITCSNVCTSRECSNLVIADAGGNDPYMDSVFNEYKLCNRFYNNGSVPFTCQNPQMLSIMTQGSEIFADQDFGPCYSLENNNDQFKYSCDITTKVACPEYWIPPDSNTKEIKFCGDKFSPKTPVKIFGRLEPIKYTQSEFDALGLNIGDEFQGGIYIGSFVPGKENSTSTSKVYGSLNFSTPIAGNIQVSNESPYKKWAIIVNKNYIMTNLFSIEEAKNPIINFTSYYDGYMNVYGENLITDGLNTNTTNTIKEKNRNGFIDYYIPSIVEMMFFAEQLRNNQILSSVFDLYSYYYSSTIFTDKYSTQNTSNQMNFGGKYFTYGMYFGEENFGKGIITNINTIVAMMLFRRIVII